MISVLLVDDEEALLDITKAFIEEDGDIIVTPVSSAPDALALMESLSFDAIVSDYEMPGMNGIQFLKAVKSRGHETPFIIFTGRGREYVAIDALNNGASFYLQKGMDVASQYAELRNMIFKAVQHQKTQKDLLSSEERYRAVVESQVELICRFRPDGTFLFVNGAFCRYYGKTIEELIGHRFSPQFFPEDLALIRRHFASLTQERPSHTMQHRIICEGKGIRWQQWSDTAIFSDKGEIIEYQSVGRDITTRKRTEEELRNTLSLIAATLESTDNGILVVDRAGRFIKANRRFAEMWGIPDNLLIARDDDELLSYMQSQLARPAEFLARVQEFIGNPMAEGFDLVCFSDGRVFERYSQPMFVASEPRGRVWSFLDVTERKRAEKVLKEANKKLHLLNTVTRHDVLNQLTAISTLLQLARRREDPAGVDALLGRAEQSVDTIEHQIAFMSDYQDIDVHTPRWQCPRDLLKKVIPAIPLDAVQLSCDLDPFEIYADPLLEKVFLNLVDNAVRHGGGITRIAFSARKEENGLAILCSDDGKGIPAEEKERIFNLGYGKHTGFGLYLAREILSITGIMLDEIGEAGRGALFRLRIPWDSYRAADGDGSMDERDRGVLHPAGTRQEGSKREQR